VKPKLKSEKKSNWEIGFKKIPKLATFVIQGKNTRPTKQKETPRRSEGYYRLGILFSINHHGFGWRAKNLRAEFGQFLTKVYCVIHFTFTTSSSDQKINEL